MKNFIDFVMVDLAVFFFRNIASHIKLNDLHTSSIDSKIMINVTYEMK